MQAITTNLRQQIDMMVNKLHEILYNLVQKSEIQHEVLYWFGMCLHTNSQRGKVNIKQKDTTFTFSKMQDSHFGVGFRGDNSNNKIFVSSCLISYLSDSKYIGKITSGNRDLHIRE